LFGIVFGLIALPFVVVLLPFALLLWIPFMLVKTALRLAVGLVILPFVRDRDASGPDRRRHRAHRRHSAPLIPLVIVGFWRLVIWPRRDESKNRVVVIKIVNLHSKFSILNFKQHSRAAI